MRFIWSSCAVLLCACGGPGSESASNAGSSSAAGGSQQQGLAGADQGLAGPGSAAAGQGGSSATSSTDCQLSERPDGPRVSLTGTVCGQSVSFSTTAGQVIVLSRRSLSYPIDEITAVTVKDDASDAAVYLPEYFEDFGFLFNLGLTERGPTLSVQSGEFALETGMLAACGFGSLGFRAGTARVAIESVEGDFEGSLRMTVSDIAVLGFDPAYGKTQLSVCDGTVTVTLAGAYSHDPG